MTTQARLRGLSENSTFFRSHKHICNLISAQNKLTYRSELQSAQNKLTYRSELLELISDIMWYKQYSNKIGGTDSTVIR